MSASAIRERALGPPSTVLSIIGIPLLVMLAVEFLLGMTLNLFVTIPAHAPPSILVTTPILLVHVLVGLLLIGTSARAVLLSRQANDRQAFRVSIFTLGSILVAFAAGLSFVFGPASPFASFAMSVGFTGAFLGAGLLLWVRRGSESVSPTVPSTGTPEPRSSA
jgi:hypothetical protein